jgi:hypothetical protein
MIFTNLKTSSPRKINSQKIEMFSVLNSRLSEFSYEMLLIIENQCGFRSGYSTTDCMFVLFFGILKNKKKKLFCAFIDFEKRI